MCSLKKSERNPLFSVLIWETFVIPLKRTAMIISLAIWRANCVNTIRVQSTLDVSEPFVHSVSTCVSWGSYHYLGAHPRCLDAIWQGGKTAAKRDVAHSRAVRCIQWTWNDPNESGVKLSTLAHLRPAPLVLPGHRNPSNIPGMSHEPGKSPRAQETEVRISCNFWSHRWSHVVTAFWR